MQFFRPINPGIITPNPEGQALQDLGRGVMALGAGFDAIAQRQQARDDEMHMLEGSVAMAKSRESIDEMQRMFVREKKYDVAAAHTETFQENLTAGIPEGASRRVRARLEAQASLQATDLRQRYQAKIRTDRWFTNGADLSDKMQDDIYGKNLSAAVVVSNHESDYDSLKAAAESPAGQEHATSLFRKNLKDMTTRDFAIADSALSTASTPQEIKAVLDNLTTAKAVLDGRNKERKDGLYGDFSTEYGQKIAQIQGQQGRMLEAARTRAVSAVTHSLTRTVSEAKDFKGDFNSAEFTVLRSLANGEKDAVPMTEAFLTQQGLSGDDLKNAMQAYTHNAQEVRKVWADNPGRAMAMPVQKQLAELYASPVTDIGELDAKATLLFTEGSRAMRLSVDPEHIKNIGLRASFAQMVDKASPETLRTILPTYPIAYGSAVRAGSLDPLSQNGQVLTANVMGLMPSSQGPLLKSNVDAIRTLLKSDTQLAGDRVFTDIVGNHDMYGRTEDETYEDIAVVLAGKLGTFTAIEDTKVRVEALRAAWAKVSSPRRGNVVPTADTALTVDQTSPSERQRISGRVERPVKDKDPGKPDSQDEELWTTWSVLGRTLSAATNTEGTWATTGSYFDGNFGGSGAVRTNANWFWAGTSSASDVLQANYMTFRSPLSNSLWKSLTPEAQQALTEWANGADTPGGAPAAGAPSRYTTATEKLGYKTDPAAWADAGGYDHQRDSSMTTWQATMLSTQNGFAQGKMVKRGNNWVFEVLTSVEASSGDPNVKTPVYAPVTIRGTSQPAITIPDNEWQAIKATGTYSTIAANMQSSHLQMMGGSMSREAANLLAGDKEKVFATFDGMAAQLRDSVQKFKEYSQGVTVDRVITYSGGIGPAKSEKVPVKKYSSVADTGVHGAADKAKQLLLVIPRNGSGELKADRIRFGDAEKVQSGYANFLKAVEEYEQVTKKHIMPPAVRKATYAQPAVKMPSN